MRLRRNIEQEEAKQFSDMRMQADMKIDLEKAFKEEESFWKEKSKNTWLKEGDKNIKVFHGWAQVRKIKKTELLLSLMTEELSSLKKTRRETLL